MPLQITVLDPKNRNEHIGIIISIEGKEPLLFTGRYYGRNVLSKKGTDIFKYYNSYIESNVSKKDQMGLYNLYARASHSITEITDREELEEILSDIVKDIVKLQKPAKIEKYLTKEVDSGNILLPPSVFDEFPESYNIDKTGTHDKTYLKHEYIGLMTLAVILKGIIPIWGEYLIKYNAELGPVLREYYAFRLISKTPEIIESAPYKKLFTYVNTIVDANKGSSRIQEKAVQGIASPDIPDWALRNLMVRKLHAIPLSTKPNTMGSLITSVYAYVRQKVTANAAISDPIKTKEAISYGSDTGDKLSYVENYKITSSVPSGSIVELEVAIDQCTNILKRLIGDSPYKRVLKDFSECYDVLLPTNTAQSQFMICQWIVGKHLSPRGLLMIDKDHISKLQIIVSTALWIKGFKFLSLLVVSEGKDRPPGELNRGFYEGAPVDPGVMDRINNKYIYRRKKVTRLHKNDNPVIESVDNIVSDIYKRDWNILAPASYIKEYTGSDNRNIKVAKELKNELLKAIVEFC